MDDRVHQSLLLTLSVVSLSASLRDIEFAVLRLSHFNAEVPQRYDVSSTGSTTPAL